MSKNLRRMVRKKSGIREAAEAYAMMDELLKSGKYKNYMKEVGRRKDLYHNRRELREAKFTRKIVRGVTGLYAAIAIWGASQCMLDKKILYSTFGGIGVAMGLVYLSRLKNKIRGHGEEIEDLVAKENPEFSSYFSTSNDNERRQD